MYPGMIKRDAAVRALEAGQDGPLGIGPVAGVGSGS